MQEVRRKTPRGGSHARLWLLLAASAALLALAGGYLWLGRARETVPSSQSHADTAVALMTHEADEVAQIAVTLRSGEGWTAVQGPPGALTVQGDPAFRMSEGSAAELLNATRIIACTAVLTDDPAVYRDHLADFGLDEPRLVARIDYTDGASVTLRVGDTVTEDDASWLYMTVDGDDRLFAIDRGTVEVLTVDRSLLYPVTQPVLHQARFDRITLTGAGGAIIGEWALEGSIGDADAEERWRLVAPVRYPADASAISSMKANLASIRLGGYVGPATPENLTACGFDEPRLTITIHQAEGSFGTVGLTGEYTVTDWPESTVTLTVGGASTGDIDYVRYEDAIYTGSHYLLALFMEKDYASTLSRYLVPTALGNLAGLTVDTAAGTEEYVITRTEQVAENNELVTDMNGHIVYDYACTLNGEPVDYETFSASYARLIVATVSGRLPPGWTSEAAPHTTYTFYDVSGDVCTVALADFDAMHDAVLVDGEAVFYLIKGGFAL